MQIGLSVIGCSILYLMLLSIIYFNKERIKGFETKIYGALLVLNIIGLFLEFICCLTVKNMDYIPIINELFNRLYLIYFITYVTLFTIYIYSVSFEVNSLGKTFFIKILLTIYSVSLFLVLLLPLHYYNQEGSVYSYGPAVDYLTFLCVIYMFIDSYSLFKNFKKIRTKKYIPLFALLILFVIAFLVRTYYPDVILINSSFAFVTALMYFTIENPDMKMLEEVYKNRRIIERSNEDTSNFIFKMTQDIKNPIRQIIELTDGSSNKKLQEINNLGKSLDYLVDDALDVSNMTTKNLKLYNTRYNPRNMFLGLKHKVELSMKEGVRLECQFSNNIPEYVYGDSIKMKQILSSILDNSIDHTEKGYIQFEVNTIIKYGICRFIVDITDSSAGISIDKVNDILSLQESDEEIDLDNGSLTLKEVRRLVSKLGGGFMIRSGEENGTTVSITIDQKIVETKDIELSKKLDLYEQSLQKNKKIMVVDDDPKELSKIIKFLEEKEISVSSSLYGRDCIERLRHKQKFDVLILDDETNTYSAYDILKELKKDKKFNTPIVIMIEDHKESIKLHYLQDGFSDVILKSKLNSELERILKRF